MIFRRILFGALFLVFAGAAHAQMAQTLPYDHIHLAAPDPAEARDWYINNLDLVVGETPERAATFAWTGSRPLPIQFMWAAAENAPSSEGSVIDNIGFSFADVDAKVAQLEAAGATVVNAPRDVPNMWRRALVMDPWGVRLELINDPEIRGLHHFALRVADPEASLAYYTTAFGGERTKMKDRLDAVMYGDLYLLILQGDDRAPSQGRAIDHLGWGPIDMDATAAYLRSKNIEFTREPAAEVNRFGHRTAYVEGPGGVRIELVMHAKVQN